MGKLAARYQRSGMGNRDRHWILPIRRPMFEKFPSPSRSPRMDPPSRTEPTQENPQLREPLVVQIDPKWCAHSVPSARPLLTSKSSLHSVLKEFAEPLRTNDSRTDFFAIYRRESGEFDRDYAKKYDEDLNTSLIFVSPLISMALAEH